MTYQIEHSVMPGGVARAVRKLPVTLTPAVILALRTEWESGTPLADIASSFGVSEICVYVRSRRGAWSATARDRGCRARLTGRYAKLVRSASVPPAARALFESGAPMTAVLEVARLSERAVRALARRMSWDRSARSASISARRSPECPRCGTCKQYKPLAEFYERSYNGGRRRGRDTRCKTCSRARRRRRSVNPSPT